MKFEKISMEEAVKNGGYIITPIDMFTRVEDLKAAVGFVQVHAENPEQEEPEPEAPTKPEEQEPSHPKAPNPSKIKFDYPKYLALRKAGLTNKACAVEFGISEPGLHALKKEAEAEENGYVE